MCTQDIIVNRKNGLHTKAALCFVGATKQFCSNIWIKQGDCIADAKSLLGVLSMNINKGSLVTITANGKDEEKAVSTLIKFIANLAPD